MSTIRKGIRMAEVIEFVKANPRCTKTAAAQHVVTTSYVAAWNTDGTPQRTTTVIGSLRPGHAAVDRAIDAGFIGAVQNSTRDGRPFGPYELYFIHD